MGERVEGRERLKECLYCTSKPGHRSDAFQGHVRDPSAVGWTRKDLLKQEETGSFGSFHLIQENVFVFTKFPLKCIISSDFVCLLVFSVSG